MGTDRVILCGGVSPALGKGADARPLCLDVWELGNGFDVKLRLGDLQRQLWRDIPLPFHDLVEIATYVYCADQAIGRGEKDVASFGGSWRRTLRFHIPVRCLDLWQSPVVAQVLKETLDFLSEDQFEFHFYPAKSPPPFQQYLELGDREGTTAGPLERVVLFSGGLDSLGGAVHEAVASKRRVLLLTHKPTPKLNGRHRQLQTMLAEKAGAFRPVHLSVRVNKDSVLNKEYTQRTRSFLYASLGATVSRMLGFNELRFYENGVVSMNLPVCPQAVGSRSTRTTHPRTLDGFQRLFSLVAATPFAVMNPFIFQTRRDIIRGILDHECGPLVGISTSCAHTWESTNEHCHCGTCSQCIDRRMGIIAAGAESFDIAAQYRTDVFTQSMPSWDDQMMATNYLARASRVDETKSADGLLMRYPEVARLLRYVGVNAEAAAALVFDLYRKHSQEVNQAVETMLARHVSAIRRHILPADCLLRLVCDTDGAVAASTSASMVIAPVEVVPVAAVAVPDWLFADEGATYRVHTPQGGFTIPKRAGENYLYWFVRNPFEEVRALRLVTELRGMGVKKVGGDTVQDEDADEGGHVEVGLENVDAFLTKDALGRLRERLCDIKRERERAEYDGDQVRVDELLEEAGNLEAQIGKDTNVFGKIRTIAGVDRKAYGSVRKELLRCYKRVLGIKADVVARKAFVQHFKEHVTIHYMCQYRPLEGVKWTLQ